MTPAWARPAVPCDWTRARSRRHPPGADSGSRRSHCRSEVEDGISCDIIQCQFEIQQFVDRTEACDTTAIMPSTVVRDILIFAGQGSNQYLISPTTAKGLRQLLGEEQEAAFQGFLRRCKDAFHRELSNVTADGKSILGDDIIDAFRDPDSFFLTPQSFQSHPVLETLNLYIFEILELVLLDCHEENHHIIETAGICTGILPAILAASFTSYNSRKFWNSAVEGFRLAFWTGLRASLYSRQVSGDVWRDKPSVLGVFGAKTEEVESRLLDQEKTLVRIEAIQSLMS